MRAREDSRALVNLIQRERHGTGAKVLEEEGTVLRRAVLRRLWRQNTVLCAAFLCVERLVVVLESESSGKDQDVCRLYFQWKWGLAMKGWEHRSRGYLSWFVFLGRISKAINILFTNRLPQNECRHSQMSCTEIIMSQSCYPHLFLGSKRFGVRTLTKILSGSNISFILTSMPGNRSKENSAISLQCGWSLWSGGGVWHPVDDKCASQRPGRQRHHCKHAAVPADHRPDADSCQRLP